MAPKDSALAGAVKAARLMLDRFENGQAADDDDNMIIQTIDILRKTYRHRDGNEVPAAIMDVIDELDLKNKSGLKPVVSHRVKTDYGWRVVVTFPPGISAKDITARIHYFEEQCNGKIEAEPPSGKDLVMHVSTGDLPKRVRYDWLPDPKAVAPVPIGMGRSGMVVIDLGDVVHIMVAGVPGGGKSNALHVMACSLLQAGVCVCIIDLKRLEFAYLRQHATIATSIGQARHLLTGLNDEMDKRLELLEAHRCVKFQEYRDLGHSLPYIVCIIDELAELQDEDSQELLQRLVRLARAPGISVVCATQRPSSGTFAKFGDTKANFSGSLCFRVRDAINSRMVLDNDTAALLPRVPGRAIWQYGDQQVEVQVPYLPISQAREVAAKVKRDEGKVIQIARLAPRLQPRQPGN